jgi:putative flippase GtrA
VGASNSAVYLGVFYLFTRINDSTLTAMIGQAAAWILSVGNSFIWNRKYVFKGYDKAWWQLLIKIYMGYGFSLGVSSVLTYTQIELLNVPSDIVPVINLLAMGPVNFFIVKYWAFGRKSENLNKTGGIKS